MLHIFDVDHTVIRRSSAWHFLCESVGSGRLVRYSQIRRLPLDWLRYKIRRPDMDFIENTVKNFAGIEKNALETTAAACFERRMKNDVYADAARLIREALQRGERVIFATSSLDFIIKPLERFFGIEASLSTELEFHDGKTTGRLGGNSFFGEKKKIAAQSWLERNGLNPGGVSFYSDSYMDIPLLEYCGNPIAVNPDRILLREARKRGWKIMRFKKLLGKNFSG